MINNLGTPSSEQQINFGVLHIDTENSATGCMAINGFFILNTTLEIQMQKPLLFLRADQLRNFQCTDIFYCLVRFCLLCFKI